MYVNMLTVSLLKMFEMDGHILILEEENILQVKEWTYR